MTKISPSVLSVDFTKVSEWLPLLEKAKTDFMHWDIMDNKYVPNNGVDKKHLIELRPLTKIPFDVHLMIEQPENQIDFFLENGVDMISFHLETTKEAEKIIKEVHTNGVKVGIAINNREDVKAIEPYLSKVDFFLVMTVEAGFGGQTFREENIQKIEYLAHRRKELGLSFEIEVDGGINKETAEKCVKAGTDILVAGNYVFKVTKDIEKAIDSLKQMKMERRNDLIKVLKE